MQIDVSDIHKVLNLNESDLGSTTAHNDTKKPVLGLNPIGESSPLTYQGSNIAIDNGVQRFKIRIKSKQTGRTIDLNLRFVLRHKFPIENTNSCEDAAISTIAGTPSTPGLEDAHTSSPSTYFEPQYPRGKKIT